MNYDRLYFVVNNDPDATITHHPFLDREAAQRKAREVDAIVVGVEITYVDFSTVHPVGCDCPLHARRTD